MKILMVTDQYYSANNGLTISARRFTETLRKHGHEVRIASYGSKDDLTEEERECTYLFEKQYIPVFDRLVTSQGMTFAKADKQLLEEAVSWADIVHFVSPFALAHNGILIARSIGKPYTAAFHVQPENISASLHLGNDEFINTQIYKWLNHYVFRYCRHIHCPSKFIASELEKNGYTAKLHVISNGIDPDFCYRKLPKNEELEGKFVILNVGRHSIEKRQDVLIEAVSMSKYKDQIKILLAGKGPRTKNLKRLAEQKSVDIKFGFYTKSELMDIIAMSDLYVHPSDMEIEAMSCMEAFAGGLVPIISDSAKSATPQFAIDSRSLFKAGDPEDLSKKIDYWIEHTNERKGMEYRYAQSAKKYNLDTCVCMAEDMFKEEIEDSKSSEPI